MKSIEAVAIFGDVRKQLKLAFMYGASDTVHIMLDKYYQGIFTKRDGEWVAYINEKSELCSNDILVMRELLEQITEQ